MSVLAGLYASDPIATTLVALCLLLCVASAISDWREQ